MDLVGGTVVALLTICLLSPLHRSLIKAKFLQVPEPVGQWLSCSTALRGNDRLAETDTGTN